MVSDDKAGGKKKVAAYFVKEQFSAVTYVSKISKGAIILPLKSLRGFGRKYLKPGQDPIAELIAQRSREGQP